MESASPPWSRASGSKRFGVAETLPQGGFIPPEDVSLKGLPENRQIFWETDLPWSMWAIMLKFRMFCCFTITIGNLRLGITRSKPGAAGLTGRGRAVKGLSPARKGGARDLKPARTRVASEKRQVCAGRRGAPKDRSGIGSPQSGWALWGGRYFVRSDTRSSVPWST